MRGSQALPEGSSDFRTQCEQSSIIFEHCPKLFELYSMSSDRLTITPRAEAKRRPDAQRGKARDPCADCSSRCGETALTVHLHVVCVARNGNVGHAAVERVVRPRLGVRVDQHPVGGLPLAGMARDRPPASP